MSFRVPEVLIRFGNASYAGKTSNEAFLSYSCRRVACKKRFQRLLREPTPGHRSGSGETAPELRPLSPSALDLGLESRNRVGRRLGGHPLSIEVGSDPLVAVAPGGQLLGSRAREPRVVDVPGTLQRLERVVLRVLGHACTCELGPQGLRGVIAPGERANGAVDHPLFRRRSVATRR